MFRSLCMILILTGVACTQTQTIVTSGTVDNEVPYCSKTYTYSDGVTITGSAQFNVRQSSGSGLGSEVLGGPIRYAEVQLLDENGATVQCAETDTSGNFSAVAPRNHNVKISVNSRSLNSHVNASVLDTPTTNVFYSLTTLVSTNILTNSASAGTLTASATSSAIEGGAFNILNNLLRANEALRYNLCGGINTSCANFSAAPKVTVFWKAGINPYVYVGGDANSGVSFYAPGTDKLYILGGINGDVNSSDTDHFDDAVISHEYGHFIEDHYAKTDSPGGSHDGNHIVDPRLAWGEGWGNFFSSFVRHDKIYRDTYGNSAGTTGCYFNYDIDLNNNSPGGALDVPSTTGEGTFREFAITRGLFDVVDPVVDPSTGSAATNGGANGGTGDDNSGDSIPATTSGSITNFQSFWNVFHGDFPSSTEHFRNIGLFMEKISPGTIATDSSVSFQKINPDRRDYGTLLTHSGAQCSSAISITANDPASCFIGGQLVCSRGNLDACCSNQLASNDFYDVTVDSTVTQLSIDRVSGAEDLDLYLYKDGYVFGDQTTMAGNTSSQSSYPKTINTSGLTAGHYLLNVNVFTGNGNVETTSTYTLTFTINGTATVVCP